MCLPLIIISAAAWRCDADELKLTPSVTLVGEYSDNIFYDIENESDDYISTLTPRFKLLHRSERYYSLYSASIRDRRYIDNTDLNSLEQFYDGSLNYKWTPRLNSSVYADFSQTSRADRDIESTGIVIDTTDRDRYRGGCSVNYTVSEKTSSGIAYNYAGDNYGENEVLDDNLSDYQSHNGRLYLNHQIGCFRRWTVGIVETSYSRYDFDTSYFDIYASTLGIKHEVNEKVTVSANIGVSRTFMTYETIGYEFDPAIGWFRPIKREETDDEWGWIGGATVFYTGEYTDCSLTVSRDEKAASEQESINERTSAEFEITRRLTEVFSLAFNVKYFLNETIERDNEGEEKETYRLRPSMSYHFTTDARIDLKYSIYRLVDRETDDITDRNSLLINFHYQYDWKI